MSEQPGEAQTDYGPVGRAVSASVFGNSRAFGFSIMITVGFGAMQSLRGTPNVLELLLYGIGATLALALLEGAVTQGFRARPQQVPPEVSMLGTAQNVASVAAGVGAAIGVGNLLGGSLGWALAGYAAATVFVAMESAELVLAQVIQRFRGDPQAED